MLMMCCVVRDYDGEVLGDVRLENSRGWEMKRQRPLAQGEARLYYRTIGDALDVVRDGQVHGGRF
jgi:hypothetical protein